MPNKDNSKTFPNGRFKVDRSVGVIQFNSTAQSKTIVLEYISDGLYEGSNVGWRYQLKDTQVCRRQLY